MIKLVMLSLARRGVTFITASTASALQTKWEHKPDVTLMAGTTHTGRKQLLQSLKRELGFFDARGYGRPFRSQWRPTLLMRDSPVCVNYSSTGRQHSCSECPLFVLVPREKHESLLPCHNIPLDRSGITVSTLYHKGTQELLDQRYRDWLCNLIREFERP